MSQIPSHRVWVVRPNPDTGEVDPAAVEQMALDVATVHRMCGGTVSSGAEREELLDANNEPVGIFETVAMWWRWHPYAPGELEQVEQAPRQPQQQRPKGNGQRRSRGRGGRGRGGGNGGQPPAAPAPAPEPAEAFTPGTQLEPEPQEPPEAFEPDFDDDRPAAEFMPLSEEALADLRDQGAIP